MTAGSAVPSCPRSSARPPANRTMPTGIFTFYIPGTVDETARRIRAYGFDTVQLNLAFTDWRFDEDDAPAACRAVRERFRAHGLSIAAIAGYLNPIAHDPE